MSEHPFKLHEILVLQNNYLSYAEYNFTAKRKSVNLRK